MAIFYPPMNADDFAILDWVVDHWCAFHGIDRDCAETKFATRTAVDLYARGIKKRTALLRSLTDLRCAQTRLDNLRSEQEQSNA